MGIYFAKKHFAVVFFFLCFVERFMSAHVLWYEEVEDDCKYEQTDMIYPNIHPDRAAECYAAH